MSESVIYHTHTDVGGGEEYKARAMQLRCDKISVQFSKGEISAAELYVQVFNAYVDLPKLMSMTMAVDQMYLNLNTTTNGWLNLNMYEITSCLQDLRDSRVRNRRASTFGILLSHHRGYFRGCQ